MTKTEKPATQPAVPSAAIVVFGLSAIGKPKAGVFKGTDVAAATKAAAKLGLTVLDTAGVPAVTTLLSKIPVGRIQAHGEAVIPFVTKDLYGAIKEAAKGATDAPSQGKGAAKSSVPPRLPADWNDIRIGDRVLSQDSDPADGWWQVSVVDKRGDIISLRWPRSDRGRPFQKHRTVLGLICPAANNDATSAGKTADKAIDKSGDKAADKSANGERYPERYPKSWSQISIDQIVLAKEDGPCEQWWEAKVVKIDNDIATLQWRDYPDLPSVIRPRAGLGLMHPTPKSR